MDSTEMKSNTELQKPVRQVIDLLVRGQYEELQSLTAGIRLSATEMRNAVLSYGRQLVPPPQEAFDLMDVVMVRDSRPPKWSITMPLWTCEEGRSDLSIELTVIQREGGFEIELDDIHVL